MCACAYVWKAVLSCAMLYIILLESTAGTYLLSLFGFANLLSEPSHVGKGQAKL